MPVYKNVFFHRMLMYRRFFRQNPNGNEVMEKDYQPLQRLDETFMDLIDNYSENNCLRLNGEFEENVVLEILNVSERYIYARIGKQQDILTVHLRDTETLEPSEIERVGNQQLEIFTYLLIERENYIISFLREQSAPSIQELGKLVSNFLGPNWELHSEISSVMIDDAIPILANKDIIGSMEYKVAVPSDELLDIDQLGLNRQQFEMLTNQKNIDFTVKLVAERNRDAFENRGALRGFFESIADVARNIKIKAKNNNEYMQTFKLEDSPFTRNERFDFDREAENIQNEIRERLEYVFETNRDDILRLVN
ncbi:hypothetical protein [Oceanobacillus timonensis]|uniref:hypothetical protein n=1 Tax=Oceanobacillus timonensis TaxID=1926285 RepID=UPI0009BAFFD5|nr:hypothetical protein [Oceanobacillus timonensis]